MQVSPSASLLQALSSAMQAKRPTPVAQAAATPKPTPVARPDTPPAAPADGRRPRMGQLIDIRV